VIRVAAVVLAVVAALGGILVLIAIGMRLVPDDPADWHVDPLLAARTGKPNDYLVAPAGLSAAEPDRISDTWPIPPAEPMARVDAIALAEPRTARIAGRPGELWATYVQRSRLFGFPDYVSVRAVEVPGGSALAVWSRARFGHGDMGVNRARVERWLAALDAGG
jgi:uncharacterized protein (DUF1499 family)